MRHHQIELKFSVFIEPLTIALIQCRWLYKLKVSEAFPAQFEFKILLKHPFGGHT